MIVSFITTKPPQLSGGAEVRNYHLFKSLLESKKVHQLNLLYFKFPEKSDSPMIHFRKDQKKLQISVFPLKKRTALKSLILYLAQKVPYMENLRNNGFQAETLMLLSQSDVIIISELDGYFCVEKSLKNLKNKKVILDCHNVDAVRFESEINSLGHIGRALGSSLISKVRRAEIKAVQSVSKILVCSHIDKKYFERFLKSEKIEVIPNGVSVDSKDYKKDFEKNSIVFMGTLTYPPNIDAIKYYLDAIHPLVLSTNPDVQFKVIGKNPPEWLMKRAQGDSSLKVMGFVEDLIRELRSASVCICPLRYGSGTRLKILEYMSASKAVVSTSKGCEGIDVENKKNILIADTPKQFSDSVSLLLENPEISMRLGTGAHSLVSSQYNWVKITNNFLSTCLS